MIYINSQRNNSIIEAKFHGEVTEADMHKVDELLKKKIMEREPINLLLIMEDMKGITLKGLVEDMKMAKYLKSIKKAAVVGDKTWLKVDAKLENILPGVEVRYFESTNKLGANSWLEE